MKPAKEAKRYAKMLIGMVGIDGTPAALAELAAVAKLMQESKEFRGLLLNPAFTAQDRAAGLDQVAKKAGLSVKIVGFLSHISETGVVAALPDVIRHATLIYQDKKRRARATVLSPIAIGAAQAERLKASLKKMTQRDVDIDVVIDPSLLGGVLVKVGSTMYDSSVKGQLRLLQDELIKG